MEIIELVVKFDNFISDECCDYMVKWFNDNNENQKDGSIATNKKDNFVITDFKKCSQSNLPLDSNISKLMNNVIFDVYSEYSKIRPAPQENICAKDYTIRSYKKNDGKFDLHVDQSYGGTVSRIFAIIIYLNDVEVGGETEFPHYNIKVSPKKGTVLVFPCNYLFPHKGNVPISNDKYIATAFINYID
jgi:hypothetical protein